MSKNNPLKKALYYSNNDNSNEYYLPGDKKPNRMQQNIISARLIEEKPKHNPADDISYLNPKRQENYGPSHKKSQFTPTTPQHEKILVQIKARELHKEAEELMKNNPYYNDHHPKGGKKQTKNKKSKKSKKTKKQRKTRKH